MAIGAGSKWLRVFHPGATGAPRVVIFPHGGGSASYYHALSLALAPSVEPVIVQYPGRAERLAEPPLEDLSAVVNAVVAELDGGTAPGGVGSGRVGRPTASGTGGSGLVGYFGHSMGASIAFEVARLRPPHHLFLSGRRPPQHHRRDNLADRGDQAILAEIKRLAGTSAVVFDNPEILEMVMPALRADYRALQGYVPDLRATVTSPITALTGDSDPRVDPAEALDWAAHTTEPFARHVYTGGHFYIDEHVADVADVIRSGLTG